MTREEERRPNRTLEGDAILNFINDAIDSAGDIGRADGHDATIAARKAVAAFESALAAKGNRV